jgi:hypothetical protein
LPETLTRESMFDLVSRTGGLGETLAYCRIQLGQFQRGLEELESAQAAELRRVLTAESSLPTDLDAGRRALIVATREKLHRLRIEFSRSPDRTGGHRLGAEVATEIRTTQATLKEALAGIETDGYGGAALSAAAMLELIPKGGIAIVPVVTLSGGAVYVIPHGTTAITRDHAFDLPELKTRAVEERLESWLIGYRRLKEWEDNQHPRPWAAFEPTVVEVLDWLWTSLMQPALRAAERMGFRSSPESEIVILATGGLSYLPLHAAWNRVSNRYVIDDVVVTYVPSFHSLQICRQRASDRQRGKSDFFGLFDPEHDNPEYRLKLSEKFEMPQLKKVFAKHRRKAKTVMGKEATPAALRIHGRASGYIHVSCHGEFDWSRPDRSGVVLADGEVMDLPNIADLDFPRSRLVSLAACETAITAGGRLASEQVGLPAAFLQAGAPAVIATLWPVVDAPTAAIMVRMYDLLLDDELRPAFALQRAVLEFRDGRLPKSISDAMVEIDPQAEMDHCSPFFWAAFVAIGY